MAGAWDGTELETVLAEPTVAPFRGRLGIGEPPASARLVPATALMTPAHLAQVCGHFDKAHGVTPARAVASIWSKWHFAIVMPAWFIGRVLMGRRLPIALDALRFEINDEGRTLCVWLPEPGEHDRQATTPDTSWNALVEQHLRPTVELLAERTGVTRRVLWNNAGNLFEAFVRRLDETYPGQAGLAPARELLEAEHGADGRPNPMFKPVLYPQRADGPHRVRRICCMRYLVPDRVFCSTCPSPLLNAFNNACTPP